MERSSGLFDATSPLFQKAVYTCLGLLLFFAACGIIWDYGYMRHWKKKTEMGTDLLFRKISLLVAVDVSFFRFYFLASLVLHKIAGSLTSSI